jgi:cobalamin synthase
MKETIIALALIVLLIVIMNPLHLWMPTMLQMLVLVGILAAFSIFAVFVLRERAADEREGLHRMLAGHAAFLTGAAVLTVAIIIEELHGALDVWLVIALVIMILAKIGAALYSDKNR